MGDRYLRVGVQKYKETGILDKNEIYPYVTEGIGEDFLPANVDFDVIDHFEKVTDKDAAVMTRRITREEGIFAGNSAGSAMAGLPSCATTSSATTSSSCIFTTMGRAISRRSTTTNGCGQRDSWRSAA